MKVVLFDGEKVVADDSLATPRDSLDHFLVMVKALVDPLLGKAKEIKTRVEGVGLGIAGVIDYSEDKMLVSPNLDILNNIKLSVEMSAMFDLPVKMDNDGNTFALAEATLGAGQKHQNVYAIVIGTGIGGCWLKDGEIYRAAHGGSGEPGEMIIDFSEPVFLEEAYHKLTQNNPERMAEEAYRGDVLAEKAFAEVGDYLGIAFANIANLIAPEIIIIGGGVVESSDLFLSRTKKKMREHIASPILKKQVKIVKAKLGPNAGAIGAALLVNREA